ncbi:SEC-C metal-binding domain-containing protein [Paenibacillus sp. GYB003]|uniref:SEC-C metal-binding domain-containing protein n=1 Tax=Paenibacillus sp. GYB003 TaxID=2994392 RepID=UPI002F968B6C
MDKRLSRSEQKALTDVMDKAKKARERMEAQEQKKRWAEMELPLTLAGGLARLTKAELTAIRTVLDIRGASTLDKGKLADVLVVQIPEKLPALLGWIDETRYTVLKKIAAAGGHAFVPLEPGQIDYFKSRGLLFPGTYRGKKTLAMPQEVVKLFKEMDGTDYRRKVRANTEAIRLVHGLLYHYGFLSHRDFRDFVDRFSEAWDGNEFERIEMLYEAGEYYGQIEFGPDGYFDTRAWNLQSWLGERMQRTDLPFFPATKEQLLQAGEPGYVERRAGRRDFIEFVLDNYDYPQDETESLADQIVILFKNGDTPADAFRVLLSAFQMDDESLIRECMDCLVGLYNETNQWPLKGYSPSGLSAARSERPASNDRGGNVIDFATRRKVGRNDPCPCGSGKKFKKCCGR